MKQLFLPVFLLATACSQAPATQQAHEPVATAPKMKKEPRLGLDGEYEMPTAISAQARRFIGFYDASEGITRVDIYANEKDPGLLKIKYWDGTLEPERDAYYDADRQRLTTRTTALYGGWLELTLLPEGRLLGETMTQGPQGPVRLHDGTQRLQRIGETRRGGRP